MNIKCSIVISVLESYDVVNRQIRHFANILPDDWELILMDDGSEPSIAYKLRWKYHYADYILTNKTNIHLFETNKERIPWHQPAAKNMGAVQKAQGEYILGTDIDHIITREAIQSVNDSMPFYKMVFPRTWAVLNPDGAINQDVEVLKSYGLKDELVGKISSHANTFAMQRRIFLDLGGYDEKFCGSYGGDDQDFNNRYGQIARPNGWQTLKGEMIYVYPDPRNNFRDFHKLRQYKIKTGSYSGYNEHRTSNLE